MTSKVPVHERISLIIVGAQKAGTTSLKEYLGEHPGLKTHPQKEFAYFYDDREYSRGYLGALRRYFEGSSGGKKLIAKNAGLYFKEDSLLRLKNHNPDIKLVFIMRDPVERTYSAYNMEINYASIHEPFDHIRDVVNNENREDWKFEIIIGMSMYCVHLAKIFSIFPQSQVKLLRYEDLRDDPQRVCRELFEWLEVDPGFIPDLSKRYNETLKNRSPFFGKVVKKLLDNRNPIKKMAKSLMPTGADYRIGEKMRKMNRSERRFNEMSIETEQFLRGYFKPYNDKLTELTGIDFSDWNICRSK